MHGISQILEKHEREEILQWISEFDYKKAHTDDLRKGATLYKTGNWLLEHSHYQDWRFNNQPFVLWLHGFMGSGKTCLAHLVIEHIKSSIQHELGQQLAYFYTDGSEASRDTSLATTILRCLLEQLADLGSKTKLTKAVVNAHTENVTRGRLTEAESITPIQQFLNESSTTFIVLDGLDECNEKLFSNLMDSMTQLYENSEGRVRFFFCSRRLPDIEDRLKAFNPKRIDVSEHNSKDIGTYIKQRVKKSTKDRRRLYQRGTQDQGKDVICVLQENAQGMFRWVDTAFDYLHGTKSYADMQTKLEKLTKQPKLFELYDEIYKNSIDSLETSSQVALRLALTLMLYQNTEETVDVPLDNYRFLKGLYKPKRKELRQRMDYITVYIVAAVAYAQGDDSLFLDPTQVTSLCPTFILYKKPRKVNTQEIFSSTKDFRFPHFSVRDYLQERRADEYDYLSGHCYLAKQCLKVFSDNERYTRAENTAEGLFINNAAKSWILHLFMARKAAAEVPWKDFASKGHLNEIVASCFLDSPAPEAFAKWHSHIGSI